MARIKKVLRTLNPADILTKYIAKDTLHRHVPTFGFEVWSPTFGCAALPITFLFPEEPKRERRAERIMFCGHVSFHVHLS